MKELSISRDSFLVSGDRVFFSLQGEGQSLGKPAVFLRLHLCNLHCAWCDTRYTWDKQTNAYFDEPERWSIEQAWEAINRFPAKRIVVTGGEPLLHSHALDKLINLIPSEWKIEFETNGTIPPTAMMISRQVQFNVSPKLSNSDIERTLRHRPEVLRIFNQQPNTTYKFVVASREDVREVENIVSECGIDSDKVILMPEGMTQRAISEHGRAVAELCKENGWRLMPRLHVMLWGKKRRI